MPQHVLLGCRPPESLRAVRDGLEAAGHRVQSAEELEGVLAAARSSSVDLVIVAEALSGGTGTDACMVLGNMTDHAPLLYVGELLVPGADAFAPPSDPGAILEQALTMLDGAALIESLGDVQQAADADDPLETRVSSPPPPAPAANGPARPAAPPPDKSLVDALLKKVREADYFEILGVTESASTDEVRSAHAALRGSLAALDGAVPRAQLEELLGGLDEARDVLCEPVLRAAYARNRM